jgi:3-oxosteroid 1-dehydrogenase
VIASGGFEWNTRLQSAFRPFPVTPISAPSNEGDGLVIGLSVGASVESMTSMWGVPVICDPEHVYDGRPSGRIANIELTLPGSIMVDSTGRRFVNEALNYQDLTTVFGEIDPATGTYRHSPAWLVFDERYRNRYSIAGHPAGASLPWVTSASTLGELAQQCGIAVDALEETVKRFNMHARDGADPEFRRGSSAQDRHLGDKANLPNPTVASLESAPFHAVPIHPGALGTSGGIRTDDSGRVVAESGEPIAGLYAAGNVTSSVFGGTYPGGGATLGSAITRSYAIGAALAEDLI